MNNSIMIYDPRDNTERVFDYSINPVLILSHYLEEFSKHSGLTLEKDYYRQVIINANFCDEVI